MHRENKELYEFDKFRLDVSERFLLRNGKRVALTDRAFDTLCALVRRDNQLISKDELMTEVWADAIVEENNLDKNISALRRILGERGGKHTFIETVRGHGFRFVAEVRRVEDLGFGVSDLGFQSESRNGDERTTTTNDELTNKDQKSKTNDRTENPQSQIPNPKSNVVALAAWRHEIAADDETSTAEPATDEIQNEPISKAAPSDSVPKIESGKFRRAALAICVVLVMTGIGYVLYQSANPSPMIFEAKKTTRITSTGKVKLAAVSPDGKLIAYAQEENNDQQSLWIRHIASESSAQIAPPSPVEYRGLNISPDGNSLYYVVGQGSLYKMLVLGGASKKIADGLYTSIRDADVGISPDSQQIAFVRRFEKEASALFIINANGTNERALAAFEQPIRLGQSVAWSPDGKVIACRMINNGIQNALAVQVADGTAAPILMPGLNSLSQTVWMPDSKSLLMIDGDGQIHQILYPSGETRQINVDAGYRNAIGLTSDGRFLVTVKTEKAAHIWTVPSDDTSRAKQLTAGFEKEDGVWGLSWMPDGRVVYGSEPDGEPSVWLVDANNSTSTQISKGGHYQTVSPDGRFIVYQRGGLWQMDASDGREKRLTKGVDVWQTFSPDGKWLVFTRYAGRVGLWKVSSAGGEPTPILDENAICPAVSPDGKTVAFVWRRAGETSRIALVSFDGGEILKSFDAKLERNSFSDKQNLQWTADGRGIYFIALNDGVSNIWQQPIDGSAPLRVTNFTTGRIFNFAFSSDGSQLALSRGTLNSDVVLIENQ